MPNWCSNILSVTGDPRLVERFLAEPFSAQHYVPLQEPSAADLSEAFARLRAKEKAFAHSLCGSATNNDLFSGYCHLLWRISKWGTKWDWKVDCIEHVPQRATLKFDTAWTPPLPVVSAASKAHQGVILSLRFMEPGVGFRGEFVVAAGRCIRQFEEKWDWEEELDCEESSQ
jgi:hypothetical protein